MSSSGFLPLELAIGSRTSKTALDVRVGGPTHEDKAGANVEGVGILVRFHEENVSYRQDREGNVSPSHDEFDQEVSVGFCASRA